MSTVNVDYLIETLRLRIGDTDSTAYRYIDDWLKKTLILAVKTLGRYWGHRYQITDSGVITRDTTYYPLFDFDETNGVIQNADEPVIVLMATIILLEGSLENSAYDLASWRDNEISFTNLESGRTRSNNLQRLWNELDALITPPTKKLARAIKGSLPGYINNDWERGKESIH